MTATIVYHFDHGDPVPANELEKATNRPQAAENSWRHMRRTTRGQLWVRVAESAEEASDAL